MEIVSHFGTIDFDESYDYKAERNSCRAGMRQGRDESRARKPSTEAGQRLPA
jgi:hypothetical protein